MTILKRINDLNHENETYKYLEMKFLDLFMRNLDMKLSPMAVLVIFKELEWFRSINNVWPTRIQNLKKRDWIHPT